MRLLFLGDVMGRSGRDAVSERLPGLIAEYEFDFVVINGENASHGRGLTESHYADLRAAGADVVTLGDHAWDQRDTLTYIEREPTLLRPINFAPGVPGRGANLIEGRNGHRVLVINALGRVFMNPADDPFRAVEAAIAACPLGEQADAVVVDFHTEATSEIQAMGMYLDGRASLVVGTHTPHPDRRRPHPALRHGADVRCRHVRRLQFGDRHGGGGTAQPLPHRHRQFPLHPGRR
jgi:metallophosphoesterase (TIGR00282 family)